MTPDAGSAEAVARTLGSASIQVLGQVAGRPRPARVLHSGADAVYVDLEGTCTGVLTARAVQVPCAIRTPLGALPTVDPGAEVTVGDGSLTLPGLVVHVTEIVDTTVPVLAPAAAAGASGRLRDLSERATAEVRELLPRDAVAALVSGDAQAVRPLLGRGPGLTPLADDVLGGWLATAVATRHPGLEEVRRSVALSASERTTTLSATLLACASRGEVVPELRRLLAGLVTDDPASLGRSVELLCAVGDTSGAGLLLGTVCALESLAALVGAGR
jgi:hypothetical protein